MTTAVIAGDIMMRAPESNRAPGGSRDAGESRKSDFSCFLSKTRSGADAEKSGLKSPTPDTAKDDNNGTADIPPLSGVVAALSVMTSDKGFFQQLMPENSENKTEAPTELLQVAGSLRGDLLPADNFIERIMSQKQASAESAEDVEVPDPNVAKGEPVQDFREILKGKAGNNKTAVDLQKNTPDTALKTPENRQSADSSEDGNHNAGGKTALKTEIITSPHTSVAPDSQKESIISEIGGSIKISAINHPGEENNVKTVAGVQLHSEPVSGGSVKASAVTAINEARTGESLPFDIINRINREYRPEVAAMHVSGQNPALSESADKAVTLGDLPRRIGEVIKDFSAGGSLKDGSMELKLDPPQLGKVSISLSMENGVLNSRFTCSDEAGAVIRENLSQLRIGLAQQGITLGESSVSSRRDNNPGSQWDGRNHSNSGKNNKSEDRIEATGRIPQNAFHRGSKVSCLV